MVEGEPLASGTSGFGAGVGSEVTGFERVASAFCTSFFVFESPPALQNAVRIAAVLKVSPSTERE